MHTSVSLIIHSPPLGAILYPGSVVLESSVNQALAACLNQALVADSKFHVQWPQGHKFGFSGQSSSPRLNRNDEISNFGGPKIDLTVF